MKHELTISGFPGGPANGYEPVAVLECTCGMVEEIEGKTPAEVFALSTEHQRKDEDQ